MGVREGEMKVEGPRVAGKVKAGKVKADEVKADEVKAGKVKAEKVAAATAEGAMEMEAAGSVVVVTAAAVVARNRGVAWNYSSAARYRCRGAARRYHTNSDHWAMDSSSPGMWRSLAPSFPHLNKYHVRSILSILSRSPAESGIGHIRAPP